MNGAIACVSSVALLQYGINLRMIIILMIIMMGAQLMRCIPSSWQKSFVENYSTYALNMLNFDIEGREYLKFWSKPKIVIFNHLNYLDAMMVAHVLRGKSLFSIGKHDIMERLPIKLLAFNRIMMHHDILFVKKNDLDSIEEVLEQAIKRLEEKSLMICPEGTRNKNSPDLLPFEDGAFLLSTITEAEIICITHDMRSFVKQNTSQVKMIVSKPISPIGKTIDELKNQCHEIMSHNYRQLHAMYNPSFESFKFLPNAM
uniref:Acyltransferase n=1 Tax=Megaviridae environmental sample TaxID=1737588 RepID=A0A5J6VIS8_9VIRU|nr:MAG: acyltransferase [Megaviridae environmental sample]